MPGQAHPLRDNSARERKGARNNGILAGQRAMVMGLVKPAELHGHDPGVCLKGELDRLLTPRIDEPPPLR